MPNNAKDGWFVTKMNHKSGCEMLRVQNGWWIFRGQTPISGPYRTVAEAKQSIEKPKRENA